MAKRRAISDGVMSHCSVSLLYPQGIQTCMAQHTTLPSETQMELLLQHIKMRTPDGFCLESQAFPDSVNSSGTGRGRFSFHLKAELGDDFQLSDVRHWRSIVSSYPTGDMLVRRLLLFLFKPDEA